MWIFAIKFLGRAIATVNTFLFDIHGTKNFLRIRERFELRRVFCKTFHAEGTNHRFSSNYRKILVWRFKLERVDSSFLFSHDRWLKFEIWFFYRDMPSLYSKYMLQIHFICSWNSWLLSVFINFLLFFRRPTLYTFHSKGVFACMLLSSQFDIWLSLFSVKNFRNNLNEFSWRS